MLLMYTVSSTRLRIDSMLCSGPTICGARPNFRQKSTPRYSGCFSEGHRNNYMVCFNVGGPIYWLLRGDVELDSSDCVVLIFAFPGRHLGHLGRMTPASPHL
ncbi:uncharacterized protein LOC117189552 [Drosophila miranda]|uniref:uncharacterized protein LOC117189552 n=1 Tax=Drosophila miranda TaxID=7229 RepID=UPI00143F8035|nr:uncharacterized protein LOC117189552 [Drosophila miranda]